MNGIQKRRLCFLIFFLVLGAIVTGLSVYALRQNISLFYTPTDLVNQSIPADQLFRLGGIVKKGSIQSCSKDALHIAFVVQDSKGANLKQILVEYQGILPDLFREGQSVVVEGYLKPNFIMQATRVLAKHDERYRPR